MKLLLLKGLFAIFLAQATAEYREAVGATPHGVFNFKDGSLEFHYPYTHANRVHCIDLHEEVSRKTYSGLVHGMLNNPKMIRGELKLPIKLGQLHVPSLATAMSDETVEEALAKDSTPSSPFSQEGWFAECAFTKNRILNFTSYPKHELNKVDFGPSAEKPMLTPFEAALQAPLSVRIGTRFHARLFYLTLPSIDFHFDLTILANAEAALCLLPEVKFAHRGNAAHVRFQSLGIKLLGFKWMAPRYGSIVNLILCFFAFLTIVAIRFCFYTRLIGTSALVEYINLLLRKEAKFEPFTASENYELISIEAIEEAAIKEEPQPPFQSIDPGAVEQSLEIESFSMDDLF